MSTLHLEKRKLKHEVKYRECLRTENKQKNKAKPK